MSFDYMILFGTKPSSQAKFTFNPEKEYFEAQYEVQDFAQALEQLTEEEIAKDFDILDQKSVSKSNEKRHNWHSELIKNSEARIKEQREKDIAAVMEKHRQGVRKSKRWNRQVWIKVLRHIVDNVPDDMPREYSKLYDAFNL